MASLNHFIRIFTVVKFFFKISIKIGQGRFSHSWRMRPIKWLFEAPSTLGSFGCGWTFGWENGESWWVMTPLLMVASPQKNQLKNDHFDAGNTFSWPHDLESQELTCKIVILSWYAHGAAFFSRMCQLGAWQRRLQDIFRAKTWPGASVGWYFGWFTWLIREWLGIEVGGSQNPMRKGIKDSFWGNE